MTPTPTVPADEKTLTIESLAAALEGIMAEEGGEPRKGDARSGAAWRQARTALARAKPFRGSPTPSARILDEIPRWVLRQLREADLTDEQILSMSPLDLFRRALEWAGYIGIADTFWEEVPRLRALEGRLPQ